jgi:hypothetical protein
MIKTAYASRSIPLAVCESGGVEVLRAEITKQGLSKSVRRALDDPRAWGTSPASARRPIARFYARSGSTRQRPNILARFEAEMHSAENPGTITVAK